MKKAINLLIFTLLCTALIAQEKRETLNEIETEVINNVNETDFFPNFQTIILPKPNKNCEAKLVDCLQKRKSSYTLDSTEISQQMLANILWAGWGFTEENRKTAPSSQNKNEIWIAVALPTGTYCYNSYHNCLIQINEYDIRPLTFKDCQNNDIIPPISLIYICNKDNIDCKNKAFINATAYGTCGGIAQNIYLYCSGENIGTYFNSTYDYKRLKQVLNLPNNNFIIGCQPIGYIYK